MTQKQVFILVTLLGVSIVQADEYVYNADANGDGFVSLYELRAAYYADPGFNKRIEQSFAEYDRNGDGLISGDERRAAMGDGGQPATNTRFGNLVRETGPDSSADVSEGVSTGTVFADEYPRPASGNKPAADRGDLDRQVAGTAERKGEQPKASVSHSRTELWIMEIDDDKSGGASIAELVASGGGKPWFTDREFSAADRNGDGDLNAAELDALVSSLERRNR